MAQPTILIADDDPQFLQAICVRLRSEGFQVIPARDAYQAVQFAREQSPDLIILDINMPAGDGFGVGERLQKMTDLSLIPVIYLTGEKSERVRREAAKSTAFRLLYKPVEADVLIQTIHEALGPSQASVIGQTA